MDNCNTVAYVRFLWFLKMTNDITRVAFYISELEILIIENRFTVIQNISH